VYPIRLDQVGLGEV